MSLTADVTESITARAYPGVGVRLLGDVTGRETLQSYRAAGGYQPVDEVERLRAVIDQAGLRGRGGAAFPLGRKLASVRASGVPPVVAANGEEGEPASVKDRWLMRHRPHLVLDGLRLAALAVGAESLHVYVSDRASEISVRQALEELTGQTDWELEVTVTKVEGTYVAGEETALVRAVNGGPALPVDKPPRPFEEGIDGRPTLISNVETLAHLTLAWRLGADGFRSLGTDDSPGTFLLTLGGATKNPGLYEIPFGVTLREVLGWVGDDPQQFTGALVGGYFAGVVGERVLDTALDYDEFRRIGSGLGCGAFALLDGTVCPVDVSSAVMSYFARENAGQCGACFNGTAAMSALLQALRDFRAERSDVERLRSWSVSLRGRGACGTLDGATNIAASLLSEFPDTVAGHLGNNCETCASGRRVSDPPFAVLPTER